MRLVPVLAVIAFSLGGTCVATAAKPADRAAPARATPARALETCSTEVTGSRIRRREGDCAVSSYPFREISQQTMERTGAFDLRSAMRLVDPRFW